LFDDSPFDLSRFSGVARLFPLPNLALFPHVMQPLHIFEPRYLALLEEALAGDGLIAMAVLAPGWEGDYDGRPLLTSAACLCRIMTYHKTEKGTYNVLLVGVRRIRIIEELPPDKSFREAKVEVLDDDYPTRLEPARAALQKKLLVAFKTILPKLADAPEQLDQLLGHQISLGMLTDIIAYTLDLPFEAKLKLLGEPVVDRRAEVLLKRFMQLAEKLEPGGETTSQEADQRRPFPPDFSAN